MSSHRNEAVRALARSFEARDPVAQNRLNAIAAMPSQTASAFKFPEGARTSGPAFRSAHTYLMIAWTRWQTSVGVFH